MLSRPLEDYLGTYENSAMGSLVVDQKGGHLVVQSGVMSAVAEPAMDAESIRVELVPMQGQTITFGPQGLTFDGHVFVRR